MFVIEIGHFYGYVTFCYNLQSDHFSPSQFPLSRSCLLTAHHPPKHCFIPTPATCYQLSITSKNPVPVIVHTRKTGKEKTLLPGGGGGGGEVPTVKSGRVVCQYYSGPEFT